jgi:beta-1,4-mannosyl-glycoprotein beta-1,4-N-acetylglucosaminyltransferase
MFECECKHSHGAPTSVFREQGGDASAIEASACIEGGEIYWIASLSGLVAGFVYEFHFQCLVEGADTNAQYIWKNNFSTSTSSYTVRQPLSPISQRQRDLNIDTSVWDAYIQKKARFVIEVTVRDLHPGLTSEESLIGTRNMNSAAFRLKCVEHSSALPANISSQESANFQNFQQFPLSMQLQSGKVEGGEVVCTRFVGCSTVGNIQREIKRPQHASNGMTAYSTVVAELTPAEELHYIETDWHDWPPNEHIDADDTCASKGWVTRAEPRRVWDAFTFYNELQVLRLRLHTLSHVVHRFVLAEGSKTFSNNPKELVFERALYHDAELAAFSEQIEYVVVDDLPGGEDPWEREFVQHNALLRGTASALPDDLILVSDVDEIVNPHVIHLLASCDGWDDTGPVSLYTRFYNFKFSYQFQSFWGHPQVASFKWIAGPKGRGYLQNLKHHRTRPQYLRLDDAGWHLSFFSDQQGILDKVNSYSHHNDPGMQPLKNESVIHEAITNGRNLFYSDGHWEFGNLQDVSEHIVASHCAGLPPRYTVSANL